MRRVNLDSDPRRDDDPNCGCDPAALGCDTSYVCQPCCFDDPDTPAVDPCEERFQVAFFPRDQFAGMIARARAAGLGGTDDQFTFRLTITLDCDKAGDRWTPADPTIADRLEEVTVLGE